MVLKKYLSEKLEKLLILLEYPDAWKARRVGCYYELYSQVYRLYARGIRPSTILDIGANRGMFSRCANFVFPNAAIHAFEPLRDCYEQLCTLKATVKNLECYNVAVAGNECETVIHRSSYDYSSSLLPMGDIHKDAFPYSSGDRLEKVQAVTLDGILGGKRVDRPLLMKIDVQGSEGAVLEGARKTLQQTDYLICEMSFVPLYQGQIIFDALYQQLNDFGFRFFGQLGELRHPKTAEVLQVDALFLR